jgi:hypothetical protein
MTVMMGEPLDAAQEQASPRKRIVMLVDNGVEGDSRVQKAARSAAAAGWDVILLGVREPASRRKEWQMGNAQVRLVRVKRHLAVHRSTLHGSLRRPLAYGTVAIANNRLQTVRAAQAELRQRFAALAIGTSRSVSAYDTPGLLEQWTWSGQAKVLDRVYRSLAPAVPAKVPAQG